MAIASHAAKGKVLESGYTTVLFGDHMIDPERLVRKRLR